MFLLVPAHLGSPGQRAVKRLLLLLCCLSKYVSDAEKCLCVSLNCHLMEVSKEST